jgi:hypothetical protein
VFLKVVKPVAVEQLRPIVARLKDRFARQRREPTEEQILAAFAEETQNPEAPFLNHPHNREWWLRFYSRDPVAYLHFSPERLFDEYTGFFTTHDPEYVRKKISSLK